MHKILLVDDDKDILWINQMILSDVGYSVDIYDDPEKALLNVHMEDYDLAILDYMMPKMRGDELATMIKKAKKCTGIIFLTGYSEFAQSLKSSNHAVLEKPVTAEQLIYAVKEKIRLQNNDVDPLWVHQPFPQNSHIMT